MADCGLTVGVYLMTRIFTIALRLILTGYGIAVALFVVAVSVHFGVSMTEFITEAGGKVVVTTLIILGGFAILLLGSDSIADKFKGDSK